ncbi:MAG: protease inhibitor I42 family protein [Candidatus Methanomethylophilaceae archaeon]|nr:protease inhibitor I42 family protein [Candidatus Methanomethylophilaceae archaeon]
MMDTKAILGISALAVVLILFGTYYLNPTDSQGDDMDFIMLEGSGDISVKVGEEFTVGLRGNVTTGYDWVLVSDGGIALVDDLYRVDDPGNPPRVGVGGIHYFTLKAEKAGTYEVDFDYQRVWMGSEGNTVTLKITAE